MRGEDGLLVEAMGNGQKVSKAGLNARIKELAERYATPLPELVENVAALAAKVEGHLERMGYKVVPSAPLRHRRKTLDMHRAGITVPSNCIFQHTSSYFTCVLIGRIIPCAILFFSWLLP